MIPTCTKGVIWGNAMAKLKELAEKGNIPVTTTLQGLGAFDEYHPLSLHMLGMHGSAYANYAMQSADVVIAIGARFDDRVTGRLDSFAPEARAASRRGEGGIIHMELLNKNIDKTVDVDIALEADCGEILSEILPHIEFNERKVGWHCFFDTSIHFPSRSPLLLVFFTVSPQTSAIF